ncbi:TPA: aldehyde dehydrogenase [Klebsiella pneumoniae]|nr:aldehyde dehydrogenase [Klebsiella pneumoniae]
MNTAELETLIRTILSEKLAPTPPAPQQEQGIFCDVGSAIDAAHQAFLRYQQCPLKTRSAIISALRETLAPELATLAEESATETGMGNKEDKYLKNKAALENTPGIEDLTTSALTGDGGMVLFEYSPFGVIGAVAPSTNPTETIINNSISMLAAGNSVYFSPHPGAKKVSLKLIARIEEIAYRCSGIRNLVVTVAEPTFEATQQMMSHPLIAVLAITGGPGIVAMGMKSGKKVIGAGAGNPPCIVDETADLVKAAEDIISGAAFDYNLPCIAEKSLIVVASVADRLIQQMQDFDALLLSRQEADTLRAVCLPDGAANKKLVGKSPAALLAAAGLAVPPRPPRLLIAEVEANDPWVTCEQLMPVLPIVRVADFDSALALALRVEEGLHHTAIMHSQNVSRLNLAARTLQTSIFVKNGPSYAGIGVGGGSAMDAAKAIVWFSQQGGLPVDTCVAIPTTSGTGSEVTSACVISDPEKGIKYPLFHEALCPDMAIIDPTLVVSVPPTITAHTGLDALTHALEAWVSPQATDFTDALAEKAARLVFRALPVAIRQGDCIATRSKMHNASTLAGMAFSQAGLGLNHAIAHQLGGQFHLPHGLANALLLTAVIRFNAGEPRAAKRYARLARACRFCPPAAGEQEAFQALLTAVETLKQQCAIPTLKGALQEKYPLFLSRIPAMVPAALADATLRTNPRPVDGAAIAQLLESLQ